MNRIEEIDKEISELWDKIDKLKEEKTQLEFGNFEELEGKYLKIDAEFDWTVYIKPYDVFVSGGDVIIRGIGFSYEITRYWDATSMRWNWGYDVTVRRDEWKSYKEKRINEISESEYHEAFNKMLDEIRVKHIEICKD